VNWIVKSGGIGIIRILNSQNPTERFDSGIAKAHKSDLAAHGAERRQDQSDLTRGSASRALLVLGL
jgi:hypothetical protein